MAKEYIERDKVSEKIRRCICDGCHKVSRYGIAACLTCEIYDARLYIKNQPAPMW